MGAAWLDGILHRDGALRPFWRIVLFFFFFFLLAVAGQYVVSVLPRHPLEWGSLIAMLAAAIAAGAIVLYHFDGRSPGALGFPLQRRAGRDIIRGVAIGCAILAIAVVALAVSGSAVLVGDDGTPGSYLLFLGWTFVFFGLAAAFEEAVFRGYPYQALVEWIGPVPATVLASGTFAFLHAQNPNVTPLALANIFVAGVLLSIAYLKTRSLWFATGLHLGWNWSMASIVDFPVSGLEFDAPLYTTLPRGAVVWTGGAFGPEAGIAGTLALVAGISWLITSSRFRESESMRELGPIVDRRLGSDAS